jgi:hypothetical protein
MKYKRMKVNQAVPWLPKVLSVACCDCGLVHNFEVFFRKGIAFFRMTRDNRATGQIRRHRGITIKKKNVRRRERKN